MNWLNGHAQRVAVNGSMSKWKSVTIGDPQGSIWGPRLFSVFISNTESGIKFAKLSGAVATLERRAVTSRPGVLQIFKGPLQLKPFSGFMIL